MIHKKQKEGGFFLNLTAKESFEFLIKVLGLESWTAKIDKIDLYIKDKQKRLDELKVVVKNKQETYSSLQSMLELKKKPEAPEYTDDDYQKLSDSSDLLTVIITDLKNEGNEKIREVPAPTARAVHVDDTNLRLIRGKLLDVQNEISSSRSMYRIRLDQLRTDISSIKELISKSEYAEKELLNIIQKITKLKEQQNHIESASCPTCSQTWTGKGAQDKVKQILDEVGLLSEKAWEAKQLSETKNDLIAKHEIVSRSLKLESDYNPVSELELQLDQLRKEAAIEEGNIASALLSNETKNKLDKAEYDNNVYQIKNEYTNKIDIASNKKAKFTADMALIGQSLRNYKNSLVSFETEVEGIKEKMKAFETAINNSAQEESLLTKQVLIAEESKKVIKAYTLQIFQESLDYIGEQASQILSNVPNMASSTIYFESCKETKSGSIKDEVNPIINMDGENEISIKTLSGGERTSIDLAVDLALIEMIETKAGKGADFFILVNKTECLEILQNLDTNKKIIIVDHSSELKALVHDIIMVVRQGEDSFVV
jgi:DNA repair exonuclease SbcCD ATPase subunit